MTQRMHWDPPLKPAELTESRLIEAFLEGHFPIDSNLPSERELAVQLGVTRPTLREALQRLARDGWIEIHHGRPTRVRNYWEEGNLGVLGAIAKSSSHPENFISNLLEVRLLLAPAYTRAAVANKPEEVAETTARYLTLPETAESFAEADWALHLQLATASGNPVFTLILNGFRELYPRAARRYFASAEARAHSRAFYAALYVTVRAKDPPAAERLTHQVMKESIELWGRILKPG